MLFKNTSFASFGSQAPQHSAPKTFCSPKTPQAHPEMAFSLASGQRDAAVKTMKEMNNRQLLVASSESTSSTARSRAISPANDPPNPSKHGDDGMCIFNFEM